MKNLNDRALHKQNKMCFFFPGVCIIGNPGGKGLSLELVADCEWSR